ncbi:MAG: DUF72 domain-containing protein [Promethearchaeota archaeon]
MGPFYPKKLEKIRHLGCYSKYFDITEINSSFYNLPPENTVNKWATRVPDIFRFVVKVWQDITHKLSDSEIESRISTFFTG